MGLSTWLYQVIAEIELYLRTQFSYYLGEKYGSLGYMDSSNYKPSHKHSVFLLKVEDCKRSNSRTLVVQHHQSKYNDQFPIWVMIEFFSVGMISILYNDLKTMDQKNIARNSFNSGVNQVQSWLKCLTDMRNKQAHYTRFYYWNFNNIPKNEKHSKREMDRTLFSQIVVLKNLYPNKENWNKKMIPQLEKLMIESSSDIDLAHIGFPFNWQELLSCL